MELSWLQDFVDGWHGRAQHGRLPHAVRADVQQRFSHRRLIDDITQLYDQLLEAKLRRGTLFRSRKKEVAPC